MSGSARIGTRISSRINKLANRKIADRDTIQQICDQPASRKLMTWIDTVLQDEALTEAELERYEEMEAAHIDDLFAEEDIKLPSLRAEKTSLEEEIALLEQELLECGEKENAYSKQLSIFSEQDKHNREVISRVEGVTGDEGAVSTAAAGKVLQHRFEKQLDLLGEIVQGHIHLHQQDEGAAKFLASVKFEEYIGCELEFTKALGRYSEKLFFPGISRVPGDPRDCALVGLEDEDKENSRHSMGGGYRKVKSTIRRVKGAYLQNQESIIAENVNLTACSAKAKCLKSLIAELTNGKYHQDEKTLNRMAEEFSIASVRKENDIKMMWKCEAVPLLEQLKTLQDVSILCGNYKLKLARQDYFMSRQDKVIDNLISQLARQELLQIMLQHELSGHKENVELLRGIQTRVTILKSSLTDQRALSEGDHAIRAIKQKKLCLGSNDKTLTCLVEMLHEYLRKDSHNIFHTFEELTTALKIVIGESEAAKDAAVSAKSTVSGLLETLDDNLERCSGCLEKGFTSTTHEEERLGTSIEELDHILTSLRDDFTAKCDAINNSDTVSIARKMFVYFFTDPDKLREILYGSV